MVLLREAGAAKFSSGLCFARVAWYELQRNLQMFASWRARERLSCTLSKLPLVLAWGCLAGGLRLEATCLGFVSFCEILGNSPS